MGPVFRFLIAVWLIGASGCYAYVPADPGEVPAGAAVRARITAPEAERLSEVLGRQDRVLDGRLLGQGPAGILLEVPSVAEAEGLPSTRLNQRITLSPAQVNEIEVRRLDRLRTAGLVAGGVVAAAALVSTAFGTESGAPISGPGKGGGDMWVGRILVGW